MDTQTPHLLTPGEASDYLRTTVNALTKMANRGEFPSVRMPDGSLRYVESDIIGWILAHRRPAREASPT